MNNPLSCQAVRLADFLPGVIYLTLLALIGSALWLALREIHKPQPPAETTLQLTHDDEELSWEDQLLLIAHKNRANFSRAEIFNLKILRALYNEAMLKSAIIAAAQAERQEDETV